MISAIQLPSIMQRNLIYLPRILCYVLVILIGVSSAQLVWSLFSSQSIQHAGTNSTIAATPPKLIAPPPPKPDYGQQIARLHLMGKVVDAKQANIQIEEDAPDTSLNLTLSGVVAMDLGEGYAIIENQSRKHKYYQVDDEVMSGVTLNSVYPNYVILNRAGRNEKLSLPRATAKGLENINRSIDSQKESSTFQPLSQQDDNENGSLGSTLEGLLEDPTSLPEYVSISPANDENGAFMGYRVDPASEEDPSLFYELGLMDGDIVLSINDIRLDNPNKASQALEKLIASDSIELTILREGTPINVVHNLD